MWAGPHFRADVRLLPTESGGRRTAIQTDYRPDWNVGNTWLDAPTLNGGRFLLEDRDELPPGGACVGRIEPLVSHLWGRVRVGSVITAHEGSRLVGYAQILELVDCPAYWSPEVARFVDEATQFCGFVEKAQEYALGDRLAAGRRRLLELYSTAIALPHVKPTDGADGDTRLSRPSIDFGPHDFYYAMFDPYVEDDAVGGSLADDFLDIHGDLRAGLTLWDDEASRINAVWHWRFLFDTHSGRHAIRALGALHHACNPLR